MEDISQRVARRLRERRLELGWSGTKVATLAGVSQAFYSRVELGKTGFGPETLAKLAGALGISVDRLYAPESNVEDALLDFRLIPVLDYVQAGNWNAVREAGEPDHVEKISTNLECPPSTFALRIRGRSMEPRFTEGDVVIINPTIQPRPGDFVVATDSEGDATFKQYKHVGIGENGSMIFELLPLNPLYPTMRSDRQHLAIVGVMIEHRTYRPR